MKLRHFSHSIPSRYDIMHVTGVLSVTAWVGRLLTRPSAVTVVDPMQMCCQAATSTLYKYILLASSILPLVQNLVSKCEQPQARPWFHKSKRPSLNCLVYFYK